MGYRTPRVDAVPPLGAERNRASLRRWVTLLLFPLVVACIGEEREQALGDSAAAQINKSAPLVTDPVLNRYVNRLGRRLAVSSERPDVPFRFYILDADEVNAFALPGGHIYLTRGLIEQTEDLSELGAVLAHEIGHVSARHGAEQLQRHLRTGALVSMLYELILGREPALLEQQSLRLGGDLWLARHSREDEREADRLALRYLVETGVDPRGILSFLRHLLAQQDSESLPVQGWFSSHPHTSARIDLLERELEAGGAIPDVLIRDVDSYDAFLHRLEENSRPRHNH